MKNSENEGIFEEIVVVFSIVFFMMAGYGIYVGKYVAAVLASVTGLFMLYARRMFKKEDMEQR